MIIYVVPLMPIIIAVILLAFGLAGTISNVVYVLTNILWYIMIVILVVNIIAIFTSKGTRFKDIGHKMVVCIISTIANCLSLYMSNRFFGAFSPNGPDGVLDTVGFYFVLLFGGTIWVVIIGLGALASFLWFIEDNDSTSHRVKLYIISILCIIGMVLIGNIFGFLSSDSSTSASNSSQNNTSAYTTKPTKPSSPFENFQIQWSNSTTYKEIKWYSFASEAIQNPNFVQKGDINICVSSEEELSRCRYYCVYLNAVDNIHILDDIDNMTVRDFEEIIKNLGRIDGELIAALIVADKNSSLDNEIKRFQNQVDVNTHTFPLYNLEHGDQVLYVYSLYNSYGDRIKGAFVIQGE